MRFSEQGGNPVQVDPGQTTAVLQAESDDGQARIVSVALSLRDAIPDADPTTADREVVAVFEVGCGGSRERFEVDFRQGAVVSVCAQAVTVNAVYLTPGPPSARAPQQIAQAAIGLGTRASNGGAMRTVRYGTIAGAGQATLPVPSRAWDVALTSDDATGFGGYTLELLLASGGNVLARWTPASPTERLAIPNGVVAITVKNARVGAARLSLVYRIDA